MFSAIIVLIFKDNNQNIQIFINTLALALQI